ncbi:MAG: ABC transporter permease [Candidatus Ancillula sp.]|jgi:oligopeptide transport system permease protein|nr:ABC transporter permease [Candidatus Ancillula sp.]
MKNNLTQNNVTESNVTQVNSSHFVADCSDWSEIVDAVDLKAKPESALYQVWKGLRRNPLFFISAAILLLLLMVAFFPNLFTSASPTRCLIDESKLSPGEGGHVLGTTLLGCDLYARLIFGAQTSLAIGFFSALISVGVGCVMGALAGYLGGWVDAVISRLIEVFFAVPLILGAVAILQILRDVESIWKMILVISIFGWTTTARLMRSSVLEQKNKEFVTAAKSIGVSRVGILFKHVFPNAISPIIATATVSMGVFIVADAGLTFLGLGMGSSTVSWGYDIANAQSQLQVTPSLLLFPSTALAITVLSFIFMGDAISDAIDPKRRQR